MTDRQPGTHLLTCLAFALVAILTPSIHAADWPHWRGPDRNDVTSESSYFEEGAWPLNVNAPAWRVNVGEGSTSPIIVGDKLYTLGWSDGKDTIVCLDETTGKPAWSVSYACPRYGRHATGDQGMYGGPSASPDYDTATGYLYTLSTDGDLQCWDARAEGKRVWSINLYDQYRVGQRPQVTPRGGSLRDYGYTSAPLVHGDTLIVEVGDDEGNLFGFDKRTGKRLWTSECKQPAGHSGGLSPMTVEGVPCVAVLTARSLLVVRLDKGREGRTVAEVPWVTDFINNIPTPAVLGNEVIVTSLYNIETMAKFRITLSGGASEVWRIKESSGVCSPVIHKGRVYWANSGMWCVDFATGQWVWDGGRYQDAGSCLMTSDDRLIAWANNGDLSLVESAGRSPNEYRELAKHNNVMRSLAWPHVALANGRLYCKDREGNIVCYDLSRKSSAPAATVAEAPRPPTPRPEPTPAPTPTVTKVEALPAGENDPILEWRHSFGPRKVAVAGGDAAKVSFAPRGRAAFDAIGRLSLTNGALAIQGGGDVVRDACRRTNQVTIETILMSANVSQDGPARIISFSTDAYNRNFTLGQERDQFVLRLRTPRTGENGMNPQTVFGKVTPGIKHHVLVTYQPGRLTCYVDGRKVADTTDVQGDLSNWSPQTLILGDEADGERDWAGHLYSMAIFNRFINEDEAKRRAAAAAR